MGLAGRIGRGVLLPIGRRIKLVRQLATYLHGQLGPHGYEAMAAQFIANGATSRWNIDLRRSLVQRFEAAHDHVPVQSTREDALVVAEAALSGTADGDLVECGAFAGAMTAKLSIVARLLGRQLFVFDSFQGLPQVPASEAIDHHGRGTESCRWEAGACRASLDEVKGYVARHGEIASCTFIRGWFEDTLVAANLPAHIALAYTDVVLPSSAITCARRLWPRLSDGAVYFSRDVALTNVLQAMSDQALWRDELASERPVIFGSGFGLNDASPYLGFMIKGGDEIRRSARIRIFKPDDRPNPRSDQSSRANGRRASDNQQ